MFKNMKLGTKIISGFAVVLVLTAIVGYVGFSGLSSVVSIVDTAGDANHLIQCANDCRQEEKNFMLTKDVKFQKENNATMEEISAQVDLISAKVSDPADRNLLTEITNDATSYKRTSTAGCN